MPGTRCRSAASTTSPFAGLRPTRTSRAPSAPSPAAASSPIPSVAPVMMQVLPFTGSCHRHDILHGLPGLRARSREHGAINDARVINAAIEEAADTAGFMHDQHPGGMIPGQRARMQRELRHALRDRHVFETAATLIVRTANTAAVVERAPGTHAGFGATVSGASQLLRRHVAIDVQPLARAPRA